MLYPIADVFSSLPAIELSKDGDILRLGCPLSVDVLLPITMDTVTLVTLRHLIEAVLRLELGELLVDQGPDSEVVVLGKRRVTSKGCR